MTQQDDFDPITQLPAEIHRLQPYQARKIYICPGCNHEIAIGVGHFVIVPKEAPDLRRHWHKNCWGFKKKRPLR